jgi:hypothetical protein
MRSSLLAVALVAALALASAGSASSRQTAAGPRVTVAGIESSLVAGRGAQLGIVEQEAENADTNGAVLPFDTSAYTLSGEASGRQAVKLTPGQYVAFTLTAPQTRSRSATRCRTRRPAGASTRRSSSALTTTPTASATPIRRRSR